jgi:hypothetical protein
MIRPTKMVKTRSMTRKENEEAEVRRAAFRQKLEAKSVESEKAAVDIAVNAFKDYLNRYNTAVYRVEMQECVEEMMEYLMCDNAAVLIRTHPPFREIIRMKIRQFMRESPTPRLAYTLGMLQQKYFA